MVVNKSVVIDEENPIFMKVGKNEKVRKITSRRFAKYVYKLNEGSSYITSRRWLACKICYPIAVFISHFLENLVLIILVIMLVLVGYLFSKMMIR